MILDIQINLMIDRLKLLCHYLILHPQLLHLLVLLDIHLPACFLTPLRLCVVVFEYFGFIVDCPEDLVVFVQLCQLLFLSLFDILQVINGVLIHQGIFIGLSKFVIFIFIFLIILFFLMLCVCLFVGVRQLCLMFSALML